MHHSPPSAITYPSSPQLYTDLTAPLPPPALLPTSRPYYPPHGPTTRTRPASTLLHPALLPTSLPYHLHLPYSTQLYYPPHCLSTCTRPTPLLGYLSQIRLPYLCAHCTHIYYCDLTGYTYYPAHRTHVPHSTPPCPSPPQMYHATPISYRLYHIALPRIPLSSI